MNVKNIYILLRFCWAKDLIEKQNLFIFTLFTETGKKEEHVKRKERRIDFQGFLQRIYKLLWKRSRNVNF